MGRAPPHAAGYVNASARRPHCLTSSAGAPRALWLFHLQLQHIGAIRFDLVKIRVRQEPRFDEKLAGHRREISRGFVARENVLAILTPRDAQQLARSREADVAKP